MSWIVFVFFVSFAHTVGGSIGFGIQETGNGASGERNPLLRSSLPTRSSQSFHSGSTQSGGGHHGMRDLTKKYSSSTTPGLERSSSSTSSSGASGSWSQVVQRGNDPRDNLPG